MKSVYRQYHSQAAEPDDNNIGAISALVEAGFLPQNYLEDAIMSGAQAIDTYFADDDPGAQYTSGGAGSGSSWMPDEGYGNDTHGTMPVPSAAENGAIEVPGIPGGVRIAVVSAEGLPIKPTKQQAIYAIVQTVMRNPQIIAKIRDWAGTIMRPAPTMDGQVINSAMLPILISQLPKAARRAVVQYSAGMQSPLGLTKESELYFLTLMLMDAIQAAGETPQGLFDPDDY